MTLVSEYLRDTLGSEYSFEEYSRDILDTALYPGAREGTVEAVVYCALGLGEAGEVQGKVKKVLRDSGGVITSEAREAILSEAGDVLWYLSRLAKELGSSLDEVAKNNVEKLLDRRARGVIKGSGDTR